MTTSRKNNKNSMFIYPTVNHIFNKQTGKKETIELLRAGPNGKTWETTLSSEWGRLARGNNNCVTFIDAVEFIRKDQVPVVNCLVTDRKKSLFSNTKRD